MEKLTPDAKYLLAERLSGADLIRLCSTDQSMRQICQTSRYNSIWQQKLKDGYNVNYTGDNAYMMYLQSVYFNDKDIWTVIETNNYGFVADVIVFGSKNEAINHLVDLYVKQYGKNDVPYIIRVLDAGGECEIAGMKHIIQQASKGTKVPDYVQQYNDKLAAIAQTIPDPARRDDFIADLTFEITGDFDLEDIDRLVSELQEIYEFGEDTERAIADLLL